MPRYTGPEVFGCRPVLVVFEDFKDREEVLQNSKLVTMLGLVMMVMSQVQQKHRGLCHGRSEQENAGGEAGDEKVR